jgi:hypothetical protein
MGTTRNVPTFRSRDAQTPELLADYFAHIGRGILLTRQEEAASPGGPGPATTGRARI